MSVIRFDLQDEIQITIKVTPSTPRGVCAPLKRATPDTNDSADAIDEDLAAADVEVESLASLEMMPGTASADRLLARRLKRPKFE